MYLLKRNSNYNLLYSYIITMAERLETIAKQMIDRAEAMWCEESKQAIAEAKKELLDILSK